MTKRTRHLHLTQAGFRTRIRTRTLPWTATTPVEVLAGTTYNLGVDGTYPYRTYDVSRDGRRFLMLKNGAATGEQRPIRDFVVFDNSLEELKRLVPPE